VNAIQDAGLEAFGHRVRDALEAPEGSPLATLFTAPLVTALVVDLREACFDPRLAQALNVVCDALERVGVPRGRQFVLAGGALGDLVPRPEDWLAGLRRGFSLDVMLHDPTRAFTAGRTPEGEPIELDDELREAEAILCIGRGFAATGQVHGGPYLLVPGVASLATRRAFETRRAYGGERGALAFALAAEAQAPVDLALTWDAKGHVRAGRGRTRFAALAHAAGFA
jgi:hypothetical protein